MSGVRSRAGLTRPGPAHAAASRRWVRPDPPSTLRAPWDVPPGVAVPLVAVVTTASLLLGFYHLTARSLWLDEGYTWLTASQHTQGIVDIARAQGYHLLPYYMLIHGLIGAFGDSAFVMRAPSVLAGAASVPLLYLLVRQVGRRLAALYAIVLFVVSQPLVFWQQNARDYAFVVLFAVASTLALVVGIQRESLWPLVGWVVIIAIGWYTHPEMLLLIVPQELVILLWARSAQIRVGVLALTAAGAAAALPAVLNATHSSVYQTTPLLPPGVNSATEIATFLASAAGTGVPVTAADHALLGITFALVVLGVAMLGSDLVDRGCTRSNLGLGMGLAWLIIPPVLSWIVSETGHPDFLDRYLILSLPAAAMVMGLVLTRIRPQTLGVFGLIYLTIFRFGVLAPSYGVPLDDFSTATRQVLTQARPGDCITFSSNQARLLYDYYSAHLLDGSHGPLVPPSQQLPLAYNGSPAVVLHYNDLTEESVNAFQGPTYVAEAARICTRMWLFQSHAGSPSGSPTSRRFYVSFITLENNLQAWYHQAGQTTYKGVVVELYYRDRAPGQRASTPPEGTSGSLGRGPSGG